MSTKELQAQLSELVRKFNAALAEAEAFAIEHKLGFSLSPAYGMGGYFDGEQVGQMGGYGEESDGWNPSSQGC
jgi:hypothetical protein